MRAAPAFRISCGPTVNRRSAWNTMETSRSVSTRWSFRLNTRRKFPMPSIAKNVVAAGLADRAEIQLAYAIGVADPVSVSVDTFETGKIDQDRISQLIRENFQLTPRGIIESLDLRRPIYRKTASYGHFGRNEPEFSWEKTDKAAKLKEQAGV